MECTICGQNLKENWSHCPSCGNGVRGAKCQACGEALETDWKACPSCGTRIGQKMARTREKTEESCDKSSEESQVEKAAKCEKKGEQALRNGDLWEAMGNFEEAAYYLEKAGSRNRPSASVLFVRASRCALAIAKQDGNSPGGRMMLDRAKRYMDDAEKLK